MAFRLVWTAKQIEKPANPTKLTSVENDEVGHGHPEERTFWAPNRLSQTLRTPETADIRLVSRLKLHVITCSILVVVRPLQKKKFLAN
jgi:hypothetical protein